MRTVYSGLFNCAPERLWSFLDEPEKQKLWMKGLLANEMTSAGPTRMGSTFRMTIQEGRKVGEYQGEVLAHEAPRHLAVRFGGGGLPAGAKIKVDYLLTPIGAQTRLDYVCDLEASRLGWVLRLMMPLIKVFNKIQLRNFMKTLKRLAETPEQAAA